MRTKLATACISISAAVFVASSAGAQAPGAGAGNADGRPPNILLVIADDFGVDVASDMYPGLIDGLVERYGPQGLNHPEYAAIDGRPASTPTLARLARQGMVFTNAWAHPFCSPTRASIITGLFAAGTKVTTYQDPLSQRHTTFVRKLRDEAGYSTAVFGKWHLAGLPGETVSYPGIKPKEAGFDLFKGNLHAAIGTYWQYDYLVQDGGTPADRWRTEAPPKKSLPGIAATAFAPVVKVADTIEWITARADADPDKPWFAWLAFNLSHSTIQRAPSTMAVPEADTLDAASRAEMLECAGKFGSQDTGSCTGEALMRAMTNSMDTVVGKLLEAVDALDSDTYVIFVSDNGTPMYGRPNLDFIDNLYITRSGRGKGTAYESGARVVMAVRGPGIGPATRSDEFVHVADLFSTVLELAGLEAPERVSSSDGGGTLPLDAVSLAPILRGEVSTVRDPNRGFVLTETVNLMTGGTQQVGARNATFKLVCTDGTGADACELYNLADDPLEEYPLAVPAACDGFEDGAWTPADARWHYCRLKQVVESESYMSDG
jgi:arylsulfatase A-like enzyme